MSLVSMAYPPAKIAMLSASLDVAMIPCLATDNAGPLYVQLPSSSMGKSGIIRNRTCVPELTPLVFLERVKVVPEITVTYVSY